MAVEIHIEKDGSKICIADVQRLAVRPGDALLVTMPDHATMDDVRRVQNMFETTLPVRVIVKSASVDVRIVAADDVRVR